ncbi:amino acid ABC transporter permease [Paraburkholderia fungorum]|uniref:amino acid ABC transporter permease n=1 Tax=Paraburkholderia fungorum TaxID=134537 RepID=UPI0038B8ECC9
MIGQHCLALIIALLQYNVSLTAAAIVIALPVSCLCALARLSPLAWISYPMRWYVNTLRSLPLVLVMFWIYILIPMLTRMPVSSYWSALIALACFEVAYFTEFIRAGIQSVSAHQWSAGLASGLSRLQTARHVVLPQALRRMAPALLTQSLVAFQDSTISSVIGVPEILQETTVANAQGQDTVFYYAFLAMTFFVICFLTSRAVKAMDKRYQLLRN